MSDLKQLFSAYKKNKIAVYGLGKETERVLTELLPEFQIIGLLDGYKQEGTFYGMPILSLEHAVREGVSLILVAARPGPCRTIAKRIGKICLKNQIDLIDVRGNDLKHMKKEFYDFKHVEGITKQKLMERIEANDVISFDLFDTMLMRQVLFPEDVFDVVDHRLKEQGIIIERFPEKRLSSEKELAWQSPSLTDIYTFMRDNYGVFEPCPETLAELERRTDYELIVPRKDVCDIFREAVRRKKRVYIVSDTYYTKEQLTGFLNKCQITGYEDIIASCAYRTGKTQALFQVLKDAAGTAGYLHIGDDKTADIQHGSKNGIETCHLYSGADLLEMTGYMGMWEEIESFSDKLKAGLFTARIFNSPFQFENEKRRIRIHSADDIAYLFFAPMICDFVIWLYDHICEEKIQNVFFCARDGYLLKRLYDRLAGNDASVYFLTSRIAAIRSGIRVREDIEYLEKIKFNGTMREQLWKRFGIIADTDDPRLQNESLMEFAEEIIDRSAVCRERNKQYIDTLRLEKGDIAFFDFVAKGTSQAYMQRLIKKHFKGFYFLRLEKESQEQYHLDIRSFYKMGETDSYAIFENYDMLETILTSPFPSVMEFDQHGNPVYAEEIRTKENMDCLQSAQDGIYEYFSSYLKFCSAPERGVNKKLDEILLLMIHKISITDAGFLGLKAEDSFFNRAMDITDLI